jgi:hypothetical protein
MVSFHLSSIIIPYTPGKSIVRSNEFTFRISVSYNDFSTINIIGTVKISDFCTNTITYRFPYSGSNCITYLSSDFDSNCFSSTYFCSDQVSDIVTNYLTASFVVADSESIGNPIGISTADDIAVSITYDAFNHESCDGGGRVFRKRSGWRRSSYKFSILRSTVSVCRFHGNVVYFRSFDIENNESISKRIDIGGIVECIWCDVL